MNFDTFEPQRTTFGKIREQGLETYDSEFTKRVLSLYSPEELHGKKFKDSGVVMITFTVGILNCVDLVPSTRRSLCADSSNNVAENHGPRSLE